MLTRVYTLIAVGLIAGGVLATPIASEDLAASKTFTGTATFFFQNGVAGACGKVHKDSDHIVALQTAVFNKGAHCGAKITIKDTKTGKTATGVVADECPGCKGSGSIDLSHGLFNVFAPDSAGVFPVSWHF